MSTKYGLLPSELLARASTMDLQVHYAVQLITTRAERIARGESINDTYSTKELESMHAKFKEKRQ
jgi:hypothetical protein|tara:strand:- start:1925 stop:2119 length:195 start_codon:yes stop_codon:yes gene_type:complete